MPPHHGCRILGPASSRSARTHRAETRWHGSPACCRREPTLQPTGRRASSRCTPAASPGCSRRASRRRRAIPATRYNLSTSSGGRGHQRADRSIVVPASPARARTTADRCRGCTACTTAPSTGSIAPSRPARGEAFSGHMRTEGRGESGNARRACGRGNSANVREPRSSRHPKRRLPRPASAGIMRGPRQHDFDQARSSDNEPVLSLNESTGQPACCKIVKKRFESGLGPLPSGCLPLPR